MTSFIMITEEELIIVVSGFLIAFALAFGIGANDVANSFGTSVGSKVLTLKTACVLATIFEIAGAILLGGKVSKTIRHDLLNLTMFNETENAVPIMMSGQISSLAGSCIWLIIATILKFPVSGTHSIVGSTVGFTLMQFGWRGVNWTIIYKIVASWFISPLMSGIISCIMFLIIKKTVLLKEKPLEPALYTLPFLYAITILINLFSILYNGMSVFKIKNIPLYAVVTASIAGGLLTGLIVYFVVVPLQRNKITKRMSLAEERRLQGHDEANLYIIDESSIFDRLQNNWNTWYQRTRRNLSQKIRDLFTRKRKDSHENKPEEPNVNFVLTEEPMVEQFLHKAKILSVQDDVRIFEVKPSDNTDLSNLESADDVIKQEMHADSDVNNNKSSYMGEFRRKLSSDISRTLSIEAMVIHDRPEEAQVFSFAQILTATFGSFAHGANDVSNAIGPLIGLWLIAQSRDVYTDRDPPIALLLYGGLGISVGLWVLGRRVIQTIGEDLSVITPSSGVCIELGSAITVLVASKAGIPISTTHCKVGSVVCVGYFRSRESVNWRLFMNIFVTWIVTLPISAGLSAFIMWICLKNIA